MTSHSLRSVGNTLHSQSHSHPQLRGVSKDAAACTDQCRTSDNNDSAQVDDGAHTLACTHSSPAADAEAEVDDCSPSANLYHGGGTEGVQLGEEEDDDHDDDDGDDSSDLHSFSSLDIRSHYSLGVPARASGPTGVSGGRAMPRALSLRRHTGDFGRPSIPPRPSLSIPPPNSDAYVNVYATNADVNNSGSLSPWAKQTLLCQTVSGSIMQCAAVSLPSPSSSCSTSSSSSFSIADFRDLAREVQEAFPTCGFSNESEALKALNKLNQVSTAGGREGPIRIMVAVDESQECRDALDWALANVVKGHRVLCLVHVLAPIVYDDSAGMENMNIEMPWLIEEEMRQAREQMIEEKQQERRGKATKMLTALKEHINDHDHLDDVEVYLLEGEVAPLLVETANKLQPEKLIMGRYTRSRFHRVVGSKGVSDVCIKNVKKETLVLAIRRKKAGGYSVTSRVKKDFWLLA